MGILIYAFKRFLISKGQTLEQMSKERWKIAFLLVFILGFILELSGFHNNQAIYAVGFIMAAEAFKKKE